MEKSIYQMFIYDLMSTYGWEKQKEKEKRNEGNMYNFTVCWNDIKYIYVSHIVYNITNWYRFYLKFMYVKAKGETSIWSMFASVLSTAYRAWPYEEN